MKKQSADIATVQKDLQLVITNSLNNLDDKMEVATKKLTDQVTRELNLITNNLYMKVEQSMAELGRSTMPLNQEQQKTMKADYDIPGVVKESAKNKKNTKGPHGSGRKNKGDKCSKKPGPRGKSDTKELPDFWRKNFDYGESPYMNIGFIENITDKPKKKKKKKKSEIINELIVLADALDKLGLGKEAAEVDRILKQASIMNARSDLIDALKNDDRGKAKSTIVSLQGQLTGGATIDEELGLSEDATREFLNAIYSGRLEKAREIFGVGKDIDTSDTSTYNPFTGQPWASDPAKEVPKREDTEIARYLRSLNSEIINNYGGMLTGTSGRGADNFADVIFTMFDMNAARLFEDDHDQTFYIQDDLYGNVMVNVGMIDDGPDVGIEFDSSASLPDGTPSLNAYVREILLG